MTATFTKLKQTGTWGLRCPVGTRTGDTVVVTTRDGRSEPKLVGRVVASYDDAVLCEIGEGEPGVPTARLMVDVRAHVAQSAATYTLPAGLTLYAHQPDGIAFLQRKRGALLADDMGLGKTCQTLLALPLDAPILVVCPAIAKGVWVRETKKFTPSRKAVSLEGRGSFRWPVAGEVLCVNFDILPSASAKNEAGFPCLPASLTATMPRGLVVVIDEAHKVKNPKAKRTESLRSICHEARERGGKAIGLTGTPLTNNPKETYAILVALGLQFEAFGNSDRSKKPFETAMRLAGGFQGDYGWEFDLAHVKPEFAERLSRVMLRRRKDEVLNLPPKRFETLMVDVKAGDVKEADAVLAFLAKKGIDLDKSDLAVLNGSLVFELMSAARAALAKAKIGAAMDLAEDCEEQGEPCLFFSAHLAPVEALAAREGWAKITGAESSEEKTKIAADFEAGKYKGLALSIRAGGVALTLTRASRVVFVDQAWTPADNNQAMDRAHRIGQTKSILVTTLVANHDLDARVADLLAFKQAMVDATVEAARHLTIVKPVAPPVVIVRKAEVVEEKKPVVVDDFSDLPF